jgi:hypothetical protein
MKALLIILGTFALAVAATFLLDLPWVAARWERVVLVDMFVVSLLLAGAVVLVGSFKSSAPAKE